MQRSLVIRSPSAANNACFSLQATCQIGELKLWESQGLLQRQVRSRMERNDRHFHYRLKLTTYLTRHMVHGASYFSPVENLTDQDLDQNKRQPRFWMEWWVFFCASILYRAEKKRWYVVARYFFLALRSFSVWPCLAVQGHLTGCRKGNGGKVSNGWFDDLNWLCLAAA